MEAYSLDSVVGKFCQHAEQTWGSDVGAVRQGRIAVRVAALCAGFDMTQVVLSSLCTVAGLHSGIFWHGLP